MKLDKKVPKIWPDPASGVYYTNFRIPTDLLSEFATPVIQKSLRTKNKAEAERKNAAIWLDYQNQFERLRKERSLSIGLSEEFIPHLLEEWLHFSLREDEESRLRCAQVKRNEDSWAVYNDMIQELREGARTGIHPDFLLRDAAWFFNHKGIDYDSRNIAFAKFIEELSPRYARYLNTLSARDQGERERSPPLPSTSLIEAPRVLWRLVGLSQTAIAV